MSSAAIEPRGDVLGNRFAAGVASRRKSKAEADWTFGGDTIGGRVPNIKQQKRRVQSAARQRVENLRYRSTAKTLFKQLERAVREGNRNRAADQHRELVRLLDKAAAQRAIHPNKAARKKSQAARLLSEQR